MTKAGPALWVSFVDDLKRGIFFGCVLGFGAGFSDLSVLSGGADVWVLPGGGTVRPLGQTISVTSNSGDADHTSRLAGEAMGRQRRRGVNQRVRFRRFYVRPSTGVLGRHSVIQMPRTLDYRCKLLLALRPEIQEFPL